MVDEVRQGRSRSSPRLSQLRPSRKGTRPWGGTGAERRPDVLGVGQATCAAGSRIGRDRCAGRLALAISPLHQLGAPPVFGGSQNDLHEAPPPPAGGLEVVTGDSTTGSSTRSTIRRSVRRISIRRRLR